jgi:hypothetical protein
MMTSLNCVHSIHAPEILAQTEEVERTESK